MTRDELPHAIGVALVKARERIPREEWSDYDGEADDILPLIDAYVAAERERIARAIPEAVADRVTWGGEEFISVADVDRIVRSGRTES